MKRLCLLIVLMISLLLSACGKGDAAKREYEAFAKKLSSAESIAAQANIRAEYEHKTVRFTLDYREDAQGAYVTVVAPELISGITAKVTKDGTSLEYGELSLNTGALDEHGLSPMSALPIMMAALKHGHLDSFRTEDGMRVLQLIPDDEHICSVWFGENMRPLRAEIQSDGRITVYADITAWECG